MHRLRRCFFFACSNPADPSCPCSAWLPAAAVRGGVNVSQACLVATMGLKTHLREIVAVGWKPVTLMLIETLLLAALCLGFLQVWGL